MFLLVVGQSVPTMDGGVPADSLSPRSTEKKHGRDGENFKMAGENVPGQC